MTRLLLAAAVLCAIARGSGVGVAWAQEAAAVTQAREHFKAGEKAYKAGEFERARTEFEAGYALVPRPGFLLNMAHTERRLGRLRGARSLYKRYLLADPESRQRDEVLGFVKQLDSAIADEEKADAQVAPAATAPTAEAPAASPTTTAPAGSLALSAPSPAVEPRPALDAAVRVEARGDEQASAAERRPFYTRWWFWGAVGAVAVGAAVGVLFATRGGPEFHQDGSLGRLGSQ
jgi:tetratricopeptide (TPR) repeat protein